MEQMISDLILCLEEEKDIYQGMLALSIEKVDVVKAGKVEQLSVINRGERDLLKRIKLQEGKRSSILHVMYPSSKGAEPPLEQMLDALEEEAQARLLYIRKEFRHVLEELIKYNEINKQLIQSQLDYTDFCLHLVSQMTSSGTYNQSGAVNASKEDIRSLFDQKA